MDKESRYFMQAVKFLIDHGTEVLKHMLLNAARIKETEKDYPSGITRFFCCHINEIMILYNRDILSEKQWNLMFPADGRLNAIDDFDIVLLATLVEHLCPMTEPLCPMTKDQEEALKSLREERDFLYRSKARLDKSKYYSMRGILAKSFAVLSTQLVADDSENEKMYDLNEEEVKNKILTLRSWYMVDKDLGRIVNLQFLKEFKCCTTHSGLPVKTPSSSNEKTLRNSEHGPHNVDDTAQTTTTDQDSRIGNRHKKCDQCEAPAAAVCKECDFDFLCIPCVNAHKRTKLTKHHLLESVSNLQTEDRETNSYQESYGGHRVDTYMHPSSDTALNSSYEEAVEKTGSVLEDTQGIKLQPQKCSMLTSREDQRFNNEETGECSPQHEETHAEMSTLIRLLEKIYDNIDSLCKKEKKIGKEDVWSILEALVDILHKTSRFICLEGDSCDRNFGQFNLQTEVREKGKSYHLRLCVLECDGTRASLDGSGITVKVLDPGGVQCLTKGKALLDNHTTMDVCFEPYCSGKHRIEVNVFGKAFISEIEVEDMAIENLNKEEDDSRSDVQFSSPRVIVRGIPVALTEEHLQEFLENGKRNGGGHIKSLNVNMELRSAAVEFEDEEVAARLLARKWLFWKHRRLSIHPYQSNWQTTALPSDVAEQSGDASHSVEVLGFKKEDDVEHLLYYFESERSGGGDVLDIGRSHEGRDDAVFVKFETKEVACRVVQRNHEVGGKKIEVRPCHKVGGFLAVPQDKVRLKASDGNHKEEKIPLEKFQCEILLAQKFPDQMKNKYGKGQMAKIFPKMRDSITLFGTEAEIKEMKKEIKDICEKIVEKTLVHMPNPEVYLDKVNKMEVIKKFKDKKVVGILEVRDSTLHVYSPSESEAETCVAIVRQFKARYLKW